MVFEPSCFAFWPLLGGVFQHFITFLKLKYLNFVSTPIFGSFLWFLVIFTLPGAEGAEEIFSACTWSQPTPYPRGGGGSSQPIFPSQPKFSSPAQLPPPGVLRLRYDPDITPLIYKPPWAVNQTSMYTLRRLKANKAVGKWPFCH